MVTIINKIFFGILFMYVSWKGLDGLFINFLSRSLVELDINELKETDIKENRYLKIKNPVAYGTFVYLEEQSNPEIDVIYPVLSAKQIHNLHNGKPVTAQVLVRKNKVHKSCLEDASCFFEDSISITGLTQTGLDNLRSDEYKILEDENLKLAENAIIIEAGSAPVNVYLNLIMFVVGTVFAYAILKSFFRKANSLEDYWAKVTEKK